MTKIGHKLHYINISAISTQNTHILISYLHKCILYSINNPLKTRFIRINVLPNWKYCHIRAIDARATVMEPRGACPAITPPHDWKTDRFSCKMPH